MVDSGPVVSTRERIVEAAFDLLVVRGVRALTLDRVAGHAKLSKGAVLYHFKGKDELIQAMLRRAVAGCVVERQGDGVDGGALPCRVEEAPWRRLVWAVVAAACMSPPALRGNAHLFADLWDGCVDGDCCGVAPRQVITAMIGSAFVNEFGLHGPPDVRG